MAEPSMDIDRIVREVLAELGAAPGAGAGGGAGGLPASADSELGKQTLADKPPAAPEISGGDLVVSSRVVTLSEVEGRLGTVRRLVVPPQAVVTPAVRDELHRRNVTLAYATPATAQAARPLKLVLVIAEKHFDPTSLVGALSHEGIEIERHESECLIAASDRLAAEVVKPDTLGLLLTGHTAAGVCLGNRHRGVRAISGTDARAVFTAAASVGANLLVADPGAGSFFQLKQIVTQFCRSGTGQCPEVFRERLL